MIDPELLVALVAAASGGGGAFVGVKASVNGLRSDVTEIKSDGKEFRREVREVLGSHGDRITTLEAKHE